jgi:two-component system nitrate/nitrite response regulator NarL
MQCLEKHRGFAAAAQQRIDTQCDVRGHAGAGSIPARNREMNKQQAKLRLLLVDDHPVIRHGIRACLAGRDNIEVVGEAEDGKEAVRKAKELSPEVILMDLQMPQMDGLAATRLLHKERPSVKVLILSVNSNQETILHIVRSGAHGYIQKEASCEELVHAIESVGRGEAFFSSDIAPVVLNQYVAEAAAGPRNHASELTEREMEVLVMIAEGHSNKEIARRLKVSPRTIEAHRERTMRKLNVHNVAGLTRFAIAEGIVTLE